MGHAFPVQAELVAVLGGGGHVERLFVAVDAGNLDGRAERRLGDVEAQGQDQVVAVAQEECVRADGDIDIEVAGGTAAQSGVALAREPHLRAVGHAGGNLELEPPIALLASDAAAGLAGMLDHRALALAGLAGRDVDEAAEDVRLSATDLARAAADRAGHALRARLAAGAAADRAVFKPRGAQLFLTAEDGVLKVQLDLDAQVAPADRPGLPPTAKEGVEDVAEAAKVKALEAAPWANAPLEPNWSYLARFSGSESTS